MISAKTSSAGHARARIAGIVRTRSPQVRPGDRLPFNSNRPKNGRKEPGCRFAGTGQTEERHRAPQPPTVIFTSQQSIVPDLPGDQAENDPTQDKDIVLAENYIQSHQRIERQQGDDRQFTALSPVTSRGASDQRNGQQQQIDKPLVIEAQGLSQKIEGSAEEKGPRQIWVVVDCGAIFAEAPFGHGGFGIVLHVRILAGEAETESSPLFESRRRRGCSWPVRCPVATGSARLSAGRAQQTRMIVKSVHLPRRRQMPGRWRSTTK